MCGKRMFQLVLLGTICLLSNTLSRGEPLWSSLLPGKSVEADPEKDYVVSEANGPWMIMACSFSGKGAEKQARELVMELRKRYKLPAYIYRAAFHLGEAPGRGVNKFGNPIKWRYNRYRDQDAPRVEEVAVLVGDYPAADDPEAQQTLRKIKYARPQCLEIKEGKVTHQTLGGWRTIQQQIYQAIGSEKQKKGPMGHAFITTNPVLPPDFFVPQGLDDFVLALNEGVPYSLLDCPGKYTVQVATFKGNVVIKQDEIRDILQGKKQMTSELAEAARKADELTKALRQKGYEAYQFHDRYASIVTVGSFDSVGVPRPDGRIDINPQILKIIKTFGADPEVGKEISTALKTQGMASNTLAMPVKSCLGIPFDVQPIPVQVPKRSNRPALGNK